jgi:uncharacterized membrane protein
VSERIHISIVDGAVGIILVLLIPGLAVRQALHLKAFYSLTIETLMWIVLTSIGISVLGGLILNLVGGLSRFHWMVFVIIIVIISSVITVVRLTNKEAGDASRMGARNRPGVTNRARMGTSVLLAIILVGLAVSLSYVSANNSRERFAQLWLVPTRNAAGHSSAQLGIKNFEGRTTRFVVSLYTGGSNVPSKRLITLKNDGSWSVNVSRSANVGLRATLGLVGGEGKLRSVTLAANR